MEQGLGCVLPLWWCCCGSGAGVAFVCTRHGIALHVFGVLLAGCRLMEPPVDDINVVVAKVAQVRPGLLVPCGAMRAHAWGAARDHPRATATPPTHRRCRTRACSSARSRCLGTAWGRCWRT